MTPQAWLVLGVVAGTLVLLARERHPPSIVMFGAVVVLLVLGVVGPAEAFSGFSNPAPFTVGALYVVARAVEKTGGLQPAVHRVLGGGDASRRSLAGLLFPAAAFSSFLNNTPVVAMVAPQVAAWANRHGRSPSRYLMPLSFAAILGGMVTVIGTSTTIVVSGLLEESGRAAIGMFEISRAGLPVAVLGILLLIVLAPRLLPERRGARRGFEEEVREFTVQMVVRDGGPLDGASVDQGGLRRLQGVFLVEVVREGEAIAPVAPSTLLRGGDRLVFAGRADQILDLQRNPGLVSAERSHVLPFHDAGHTYFEAVVGAASPLTGKTLREADFRSTYGAAVLAIHRAGERVRAKLGTVRLRAGDTLLLLAGEGFKDRWDHRNHFLLISRIGGLAPATTRQALLVGLVLVGVVAAATSGLLPIVHAALAGAFVVLASGVLSPTEARRALDLDVLLLIAAAFGVGAAVRVSGLADVVAGGITASFAPLGPRGLLLGVVLVTLVLTEAVTNNAAAVLVFPVAVDVALGAGLDSRPFAIALALAASASFLTPIGYQTNTMVYGPGGYRFGDYARLGFPLTLLVIVGIVGIVPLFWSF